jgi:uncharacterized protein YndB with AHSA1/START domain
MFAVADVNAGAIHAVIDIDAPPSRVFDALTSPEQLASWWGSADTYRTHDWELDLQEGGEWSCKATSTNGMLGTVGGRYLVIDRPRVLSYTWKPSWDGGHETTVRYELSETRSGTRVKVLHNGFGDRAESCRDHANGWNRVLGWLTDHLRTPG